MSNMITVRFTRKRNKCDNATDKDVENLIDAVKSIAPRDLDIRSMRMEPESDDADFYGISTEISFIPADDSQRKAILSTIDSFIPAYLILEDHVKRR